MVGRRRGDLGSREESQMGWREGGGDLGFPSSGLESYGGAIGFFSAQTTTTRSAISDNFLLPSPGRLAGGRVGADFFFFLPFLCVIVL